MSVRLLFRMMKAEARADMLDNALRRIAHHVGGDADKPDTVVVAAESLRTALCLCRGYQDIPRDVDGDSAPFRLVGR